MIYHEEYFYVHSQNYYELNTYNLNILLIFLKRYKKILNKIKLLSNFYTFMI